MSSSSMGSSMGLGPQAEILLSEIGQCPSHLVNLTALFMALVSLTVMRSSQKQPPSRTTLDELHGSQFDFIIIGGGTSGCVLARRLSEIPQWKVTSLSLFSLSICYLFSEGRSCKIICSMPLIHYYN